MSFLAGASRRARTRWLAAVPAGLLCLLPVSPADASPTWLAPVSLSTASHNAEAPLVAIGPDGEAIAVWSRSNGTSTIIQAAVRPPGGAWQAPLNLSAAGENASEPQLAVDGAGDAIAVWRRYDGANYIVQATGRSANGDWQQPQDLSAPGQDAEAPQVAFDNTGNAAAVWRRSNGTNTAIEASSKSSGGVWQAPLNLSAASQNASEPQLAVDSVGDLLAIWTRSNGVIQSAARPTGGVWQMPLDLSEAGQSASEPQLAVDGSGDALALWSRSNGANTVIQVAASPLGGPWQAPLDLSEVGQNASEPQLAVDGAGDAIAVWRRYDGANTIIQTAGKAAGGVWSSPLDLSVPGQNATEPQVAIDPVGKSVAVWSRFDGANMIVQSATRSAGGVWSAVRDLSVIGRSAFEPQVTVDPEGDAAAIWSRFDGANSIIQAAGYDTAGPRLASLLAPTAGTVLRPLSFSVSPLDVWSAIGSTAWSFGDGTVAVGSSVGHAYSRPGVYTVSVTAADVLGNTSDASRIVTIFAKANAARNVLLRGRVAALRLHCPSSASCEGEVRLVAAVEVRRHRRHVAKRLQIGRKSFDIPAETTTTVLVDISAKGRMAVHAAGRRGLKAQLTGTGVKHRVLMLRTSTPSSTPSG
jgi:hypothetical protein